MEFFEAVQRRRSVRRFTPTPVPESVMNAAFEAAQLAPNSSNLQTCEFYWVRSVGRKEKLAEACLSQGAARTAQELVVVVSRRDLWKRNNSAILEEMRTQGLHPSVQKYYGKLIPFLYGFALLTPLKMLMVRIVGLFRPITKRPVTRRDLDEVSIKSAALACENFMLAIAAQGFDTCPMEGFDESRVRKIVGTPGSSRVVMVIGVGQRDPKGIWGNRFRLPKTWFLKEV